ncbi:MAG: MATE family efflux transporter [Bacteroidia bacterium]|nr:MATE family efflux transporter [Bacteroidia bacterium]
MKKLQATYKDIWHLAAPIIAGSIAHTLLNLTDTAFLGRVGETELGAAAIAGVYYFVLVMIGMAIGIGSQILMARRAGEGNPKAIGRVFDHTIIILIVSSAIMLFLLYGFTPYLFSKIITDHSIFNAAKDYVNYRGWAILPALMVAGCRGFFIGIARTGIITVSSVMMLLINALLDYILIFGKAGAPAMGIAGAGLASGMAELITSIFLLSFAFYRKSFKMYSLFRFSNMAWKEFKSLIELSSPIMVQNLITMGSYFVFFVFIEHMGSRELAISNIVRATYMLLMTPMWGFSSAANSMTSNLIGQGKGDQVFLLLKKIITMSFFLSLVIGLVFVSFPNIILRLVTNDLSLIQNSLGTFYVTCAAILVFSISLVLFSGVSGTGNTRIALLMETVNIAIYIFYVYACVYWLNASLEWVWFSEILYWALMGIFSLIYLRTGHWRKIRI